MNEKVLVINFGAQYAQLIARRVREASIYSEIVPHSWSAYKILEQKPDAIILSGGPASVYAPNAPKLDPAILESGVPILGICYGFQAMANELGGLVKKTEISEYGPTLTKITSNQSCLLKSLPNEYSSWMSHGDSVEIAPKGFTILAHTQGAKVAAFANDKRGLYGVQWHPEVKHSEFGQNIIENFLYGAANLSKSWSYNDIIENKIKKIKKQVGDSHVLCAISGGVDSAVAAALVKKAIGSKLHCVFVDHGLLRLNESSQVNKDFHTYADIKLFIVNEKERFLSSLVGVSDPEDKRKIIGKEFIRSFEDAACKIFQEIENISDSNIKFLLQGTLYPDVVESGDKESGSATIKSHHNVGGLPDDLQFTILEPLRDLFKDEVRIIGQKLGLPKEIVNRKPFPGPGLGVRIIGEITEERVKILQAADSIVNEEIENSYINEEIWQISVILLAKVRSVGVQGDNRTYGHPIVLRPVSSEDGMTADWVRLPYDLLAIISSRITNEISAVNRVVLDVTSKPPGTIEWE